MKNIFFAILTIVIVSPAFAQFHLDVEGHSRIRGNLDISYNIRNVHIGTNAGLADTIGLSNTFVGVDAGEHTWNGNDNTFLGYKAGNMNLGADPSMIPVAGRSVLGGDIYASKNTFIGAYAGELNELGSFNTW